MSILKTQIDQDKFLILWMLIEKSKRPDHRKAQNVHDRNSVKYFIPTTKGKILVCSTVFRSITSISRKCLNIIAANFMKDFYSPKEKRGESRLNSKD